MGIDFIIFYIIIFIIGAIFGSFACCQAWRLHERSNGKKLGSRSVCMHCKAQLKWYDNLPIISWLALRGKCRKCKEKIGKAEILSEIGLGLVFLAIAYKYSIPFSSIHAFLSANFITTLVPPLIILVAFVLYWILLVYDAKWGELPVFLMVALIPIAILYQFAVGGNIVQVAISAGLLSSIYFFLYFFSKEKLVGGGDWILCVSVAIFVGRWELALVELFLSNFAASIAAAPNAIKKGQKQIPFGPFLILGLLTILLTSDYILKFLIIY